MSPAICFRAPKRLLIGTFAKALTSLFRADDVRILFRCGRHYTVHAF